MGDLRRVGRRWHVTRFCVFSNLPVFRQARVQFHQPVDLGSADRIASDIDAITGCSQFDRRSFFEDIGPICHRCVDDLVGRSGMAGLASPTGMD